MRVLGLMSGTSLDGVDACLVDLHGAGSHVRWRFEHALTQPLEAQLRARIGAWVEGSPAPVADYASLDIQLAHAFVAAGRACLDGVGLAWTDIDLIASHGQTLWHAPGGPSPHSLQLGHGGALAALTGVTTVSDFRIADVTLGGQGAPLVPGVDRLLATTLASPPTGGVIFQNLGGIGNMTWVPPVNSPHSLVACDTGPGNCLLDAFVTRITGGAAAFDADGRLAAAGRVHSELLSHWLAQDEFLQRPAPKSTGREYYNTAFLERVLEHASGLNLDPSDILATLTAYTAASVAHTYHRVLPNPQDNVVVYVSGGGAANPTLMKELERRVAPGRVHLVTALGIPADFKEAFAFAVLGYQTIHGIPNALPEATGAQEPWILGSIAPGRNFRRAVLMTPPLRDLGAPVTELPNPASEGLDTLSVSDMVQLMHQQDWNAVAAAGEACVALTPLIEQTARALGSGGRLFYVGAGTSGRLGVLDASECPPTFSTPPEWVQGLIAGGDIALRDAVEGAEDDDRAGAADLLARQAGPRDVVVGISANGRAPYVRGALEYARRRGATTALITCNPPLQPSDEVDHWIYLPTGPELVAGSTRLKAGTATKLVLNMLSTLTMVTLGKVHNNLMVDLTVSNKKLRKRALSLLKRLTGAGPEATESALDQAQGRVKVAAVMLTQGLDPLCAEGCLQRSAGRLRPWLPSSAPPPPDA